MGDGLDEARVDGNGPIDWTKAYQLGCRWAYLNISPGNNVWDQAPDARAAGIIPGPYLFMNPSRGSNPVAATQAALNGFRHQPGDLPLVCDIELPHGIAGTGLTRAGVATWYITSHQTAAHVVGYMPGAYASARVLDTDDTDTFAGALDALQKMGVWLWLALYNKQRKAVGPKAWGVGNYWMHQDAGDVRGDFGIRQVDDDWWNFMQRGEKGPRVAYWQGQLNKAMPNSVPLVPDGDFGALTESFTRQLQAEHELNATGVVDPATFAWGAAC